MDSSSENIERLKSIVDYIEMHIKDDISLDDISKKTALSKFYLDRVFKLLTNKSLMDYVRGRKLTHSIELLLNSNFSVLDIALEYSFQHEQSYIRCFKKLFNTSPGRLRREKKDIPIVNKIDLGFVKPIADGMIFEPSFVIKPKFFVIGCKYFVTDMDNNINFTANKVGIEFFFKHKKRIKNAISPHVYIGLIKYVPKHLELNYYIPCTEVSGLDDIPSGMVGYKIETHKYAVFKYIASYRAERVTIETLNELYEYVFLNWLQNTSYSMADNFHFERIDYNLTRDDYCEIDIYFPID